MPAKKNHLPYLEATVVFDIDNSTLSTIEKGDRPANSRTIPVISGAFRLDF